LRLQDRLSDLKDKKKEENDRLTKLTFPD
jgi:hypothetical protein